jgi:hypothetical protein
MTAVKEALKLPPLHLGTNEEIRLLAAVREFSREGPLIAQERGLLRFGQYFGHSAWFVLDKTFKNIQARRLDGQRWYGDRKALSLKNSDGNWPVGLYESLNYPNIAIVEGGPDLLAAHHFLWAEECEDQWGVIAMLGACPNFPPEAKQLLKGRKIKIFYHYDKENQGAKAAYRWGIQLELPLTSKHFCCGPVPLQKGGFGKDLNDQAHISGDQFEELRAQGMHLLFS